MKIREVARLSGLSQGMIEQLLSRHGFSVLLRGTGRAGVARVFTRADAFLIAVAGELWRLGLDQATIRIALAGILPFEELRPDGNWADGLEPILRQPETVYLLLQCREDLWEARFQKSDAISAWITVAPAIVINASAILGRIDELQAGA